MVTRKNKIIRSISVTTTTQSTYSDLAEKYIESTQDLESIGLDVKSRSNPHEISALCPFHGESRPSFYVNKHSGTFFCHGCQSRGTLPELVSKLTGDAVELCSYNIYRCFVNPTKHKIVIRDDKYYRDMLYSVKYDVNPHGEFNITCISDSKLIIDARDGCISEKSIDRFGLSSIDASISGSKCYKFIQIPCNMCDSHKKDLEMNFVQYRFIDAFDPGVYDKRYYNLFQKNNVLFNLSGMMKTRNKSKPIFITEGAFDAIRIMEVIGYDYPVVSCYSSSISEEQLAMILAISKNLVVCFDDDKSGNSGVESIRNKTKDVECITIGRVKSDSKDFGCEKLDTIQKKLQEYL